MAPMGSAYSPSLTDLDVINRWYHIEKEVENPVEPYCRFLYVAAQRPMSAARYEQGQNWWFVPHIHGENQR